jgi:aspartate 1-decarboxylase
VPPGAAEVIANGPAARLLQRGGTVIITYTQLTDGKLPGYQPVGKVACSPTSGAAICEIPDQTPTCHQRRRK